MSNTATRRIQKECKEVVTSDELAESGITIEMLDDASFQHIHAYIRGPPDTPYEGGRFKLDITFPNEYPFHPLKAKFISKVWHPNVSSQTGCICLDILDTKKGKWTASLSLRVVLLSIQNLLATPEPADPLDAVVAKMYMADRPNYERTARFWTQHFAGGPGEKDGEMEARVKSVSAETQNEIEAISVLSCNSWDVCKAINYIKSYLELLDDPFQLCYPVVTKIVTKKEQLRYMIFPSSTMEMKVFSLQVLRKGDDGKAVSLKATEDVTSFRFFERTAVKDFFTFTGKLLVERTAAGTRSTVQEKGYYCHIHVRADGLAGVAVTDAEYQSRVAFSMITRVLDDFVQKTSDWRSMTDEKACGYSGLADFLQRYQNPRDADPLTRVQEEVDETRVIMHNTIQSVLERGERLDDLVEKSENLSNQSKMFYTQARKMNSCCNYG